MIVELGSLIIAPGPGRRTVHEENITIQEKLQEQSTLFSPDRLLYPAVNRKLALLIADSMGDCFLQTDTHIAPVIRAAYNFEWIAKDVVDGLINVQRYKNIIIWAGIHGLHKLDLSQVARDLKGLVNVIRPRNPKAMISVSTLIPKPRENHIVEPLIKEYNKAVKETVTYFQDNGSEVQCLYSDRVFLDDKDQIVRPIIDSYHDGFHLNYNGAQKLRQYWMGNLRLY